MSGDTGTTAPEDAPTTAPDLDFEGTVRFPQTRRAALATIGLVATPAALPWFAWVATGSLPATLATGVGALVAVIAVDHRRGGPRQEPDMEEVDL